MTEFYILENNITEVDRILNEYKTPFDLQELYNINRSIIHSRLELIHIRTELTERRQELIHSMDLKMMKLLIEHGVKINDFLKEYFAESLTWAKKEVIIHILKDMIENGTEIPGGNDQEILKAIAGKQDIDITKLIIAVKNDILTHKISVPGCFKCSKNPDQGLSLIEYIFHKAIPETDSHTTISPSSLLSRHINRYNYDNNNDIKSDPSLLNKYKSINTLQFIRFLFEIEPEFLNLSIDMKNLVGDTIGMILYGYYSLEKHLNHPASRIFYYIDLQAADLSTDLNSGQNVYMNRDKVIRKLKEDFKQYIEDIQNYINDTQQRIEMKDMINLRLVSKSPFEFLLRI